MKDNSVVLALLAVSACATPGCVDRPADWQSISGSTCADYVSYAWCDPKGYGNGWRITEGSFDRWAVNGVAANVACCGCGGGSTITGEQACEGHSFDKAACNAVGCCNWSVLSGCRANEKDMQCYSDDTFDTTTTQGIKKKSKKGRVIGGLIAGGIIAGAIGVAVAGKSTTTPATTGVQGAQTSAVTTTTQNSSSSLLWLWILLGVLALCCLLSCCGGGLAALMCGKKKKKKSKRATRVDQPSSPAPVVEPVVEERRELLPMVPAGGDGFPVMASDTLTAMPAMPMDSPATSAPAFYSMPLA